MRTEQEMMGLLIDFAQKDERIVAAVLEGSRSNVTIKRDDYQDYDVSYFVTDMDSFKADDEWLDVFGKRLMMQKPEDMELFPPELGNWFSYLMLFQDGTKIDLTLIPVEESELYWKESDGLAKVILDKRNPEVPAPEPSDRRYWISKPTARAFDDCCNEFWMVSTYVAKGLARREVLFAIDHLHEIARPNLLRMMSWQVGATRGFTFSVGKNYKFLDRYLPAADWQSLLDTYQMHSISDMWHSLLSCQELFRVYSRAVSENLGYPYPDYDEAISGYIEEIRRENPVKIG